MAKEYTTSKRLWLNPKNSEDTGAVHWNVCADSYYLSGDFSIWDCSRKITLNFGIYNEKDAIDRAKKINMLIESLEAFRDALGKAYENFQEYKQETENE